MQENQEWRSRFERELQHAEQARAGGNEGMARVCARRAAGMAIGEYFRLQGLTSPGPSAYDRLRYLLGLPAVPQNVRRAAENLITRINVEGMLPVEADLIADARKIAEELFKPSV
jgi:hypothetical protein